MVDTTTKDSRSTGELVTDLSEQTAALVREELRLAQAEMKQKGRGLGRGVGLLGGSGALVTYGVGVLLAAAVLGLATVVEPWLAALIVGLALLAIAAVAGLIGKKQVSDAAPPTPERTMRNVQEDVAAVRRQQ